MGQCLAYFGMHPESSERVDEFPHSSKPSWWPKTDSDPSNGICQDQSNRYRSYLSTQEMSFSRRILPPIHAEGSILSVCQSPLLPGMIFTGGEDNHIALVEWCTEAASITRYWKAHNHDVNKLCCHDDTQHLFSCSRDRSIRMWGLQNSDEEQTAPLATFSGHSLIINAIAPHVRGELLASGSRDNTVRLWSIETAQEIACQTIPLNLVHCLQWIPQYENLLAQGGEDLGIRLWDVRGGSLNLQRNITGFDYHPICMDASPDGRELITGHNGFVCHGSMITVWDIRAGKQRETFNGHQYTVRNVYYGTSLNSPQLIFSVSDDQSCKCWDRFTGHCLGTTPISSVPTTFTLHKSNQTHEIANNSKMNETGNGYDTSLSVQKDITRNVRSCADAYIGTRSGQLLVLRFDPHTHTFHIITQFGNDVVEE